MRPEQVPARPECPEPARWVAPDGNATETDVSFLIGAFVTALKPDYVVETGSYYGDTTVRIGESLRDLGRGHLLSIDLDQDMAALTRDRVRDLPVTVLVGLASRAVPEQFVDLLFIDAGLEDRIHQLRHFRQYASPRCVVLMHDTALWIKAEGIPEFYADMDLAVTEGTVQPWIKLPTPRGLSITRYV